MPKQFKLQKGGRVIGMGGYGCAISPAIGCNKTKNLDEKVSKVINLDKLTEEERESIEEEFKIYQKLHKIDMTNRYYLGGLAQCKINSDKLTKRDRKTCNIPSNTKLLNIIMKKGMSFQSVVEDSKYRPKMNQKDILKAMANLIAGARKSLVTLNMAFLDIKRDNILFVNKQKDDKNYIHPVFIDFGSDFVIRNKKQLINLMESRNSFYFVWPLEIQLGIYFNLQRMKTRDKRKEAQIHFEKAKKKKLDELRKQIKHFIGVDVVKSKQAMFEYFQDFMDDLNSKKQYNIIMEKIMVYEIALAFAHLSSYKGYEKLADVVEFMMVPTYMNRPTLAQALGKIKDIIGPLTMVSTLIEHKKLTRFQKFKKFLTKKRGGMRGGGAMKRKNQTWAQYWKEETDKEMARRYKDLKIPKPNTPQKRAIKKIKKKTKIKLFK